MKRHGDPAQWENEVHQALKPEETTIMRLMKARGDRGTLSLDLINDGYPKSHQSLWGWLMKLQHRGLIERAIGGSAAYFYVTEYGRWMTRNDT